MKRIIFATIIVSATMTFASAGLIRGFVCKNQECRFEAEVSAGRGKISTIAAGYCTKCEKMVTANFPNEDLREGKLTPLARVWDSMTGRTLDLYECPHCKKPFASVNHQMVFCPKCGKKTMSVTVVGHWD